ncbi:MAG TPA: porin family protein [Parafilimonas sp.]|nr:porin family protein [Parafilimonas sp.]
MRWAICALCILPFCKKAQAQVTVGPEVGFTAAGLYDEESNVYAGINLHVGATAHLQVTDFLAVRPSLLYKTGTLVNGDYMDEKYSMNRISIPVPIMYSHIFDNSSTLFAGLGPNFMYNLSGKYKTGGESSKLEFGSNEGQMKRFDMGLQLKGGYQFANGLSLSTFFNLGLSNLSNVPGDNVKTMDALGFSIGWMFGGNSPDY